MNLKKTIIETLKREVKPAVGCTEPVAVALATAQAVAHLGNEKIEKLDVSVSPNVFKNGMGVGIPNSDYLGLDIAAALGAVGGNHELGLKVLESVTDEDEKEALHIISSGKLNVRVEDTDLKILIIARVKSANHLVEVIIQDRHDQIVSVKKDDQIIVIAESINPKQASEKDLISESSIKEIIEAIEDMDFEDILFLKDGIAMNLEMAKIGLENASGIGVGVGLMKSVEEGYMSNGLVSRAMILTAAASDARMSGINFPVMSSNGSGNNGLTAILPIAAYAELHEISDEKLVKALAISHTINCYVKNHIGRLSALCGCAIASATGAAAALSWIFGCEQNAIEGAMKNMIADISGTICDGAKLGCALKLSTAANIAVKYALLAKYNCIVPGNNGIISDSIEQTIDNLGRLSNEGMQLTDTVILNIMQGMQAELN